MDDMLKEGFGVYEQYNAECHKRYWDGPRVTYFQLYIHILTGENTVHLYFEIEL